MPHQSLPGVRCADLLCRNCRSTPSWQKTKICGRPSSSGLEIKMACLATASPSAVLAAEACRSMVRNTMRALIKSDAIEGEAAEASGRSPRATRF